MKKVLAIALCFIMLLSLAACGSSLSGTEWELVEASYGSMEVPIDDSFGDCYISFDGDEFTMELMGESVTGTYEVDDDEIDLTAEGDTITAELDGDQIIIDVDGIALVFEKA